MTDEEIMRFMSQHPRLGDKYAATHFGVDPDFLAERMRLYRNDLAVKSLY